MADPNTTAKVRQSFAARREAGVPVVNRGAKSFKTELDYLRTGKNFDKVSPLDRSRAASLKLSGPSDDDNL